MLHRHKPRRNSGSSNLTPKPGPQRSAKPQADCVELPRKALRVAGVCRPMGVSVEVDSCPCTKASKGQVLCTTWAPSFGCPKSHQQFFRESPGPQKSISLGPRLCPARSQPSPAFPPSRASAISPQSAFGEHLNRKWTLHCRVPRYCRG